MNQLSNQDFESPDIRPPALQANHDASARQRQSNPLLDSAQINKLFSPLYKSPVTQQKYDTWAKIPSGLKKILTSVLKMACNLKTDNLTSQQLSDIYSQIKSHNGLASTDLTAVLIDNKQTFTEDECSLKFMSEELGYRVKSNCFISAGKQDGVESEKPAKVTLYQLLHKIMTVYHVEERVHMSGGSSKHASPMAKILGQSLSGRTAGNFTQNGSLVSPMVKSLFGAVSKNGQYQTSFQSPRKERCASQSEYGLSELHANERISNQSPIPSHFQKNLQLMLRSQDLSGGELQSMPNLMSLINKFNSKQKAAEGTGTAHSAAKEPPSSNIKPMNTTPSSSPDKKTQLHATPPAKGGDFQSSRNQILESTQQASTFLHSQEKPTADGAVSALQGRNYIELFQMQAHSAKPDHSNHHLLNSFKQYPYQSDSVLSQNPTPKKPSMSLKQAQMFKTEQKQQPLSRNLFSKINNFELHEPAQPYYHYQGWNNDGETDRNRDHSPIRHQKLSIFDQSQLSQSPVPPQHGHSYMNMLSATCRMSQTNVEGVALGKKMTREQYDSNLNQPHQLQTPYQSKRCRQDPYKTTDLEEVKKPLHRALNNLGSGLGGEDTSSSADEDEQMAGAPEDEERFEDDSDEDNQGVDRKKRGLKILSVQVLELVEKEGHTTYKDVANELIRQPREFDYEESDDEAGNEDMTEDSPDKRVTASGSKHTPEDPVSQKREKNVRRRVYDALNVLYAAGVLCKDNKTVTCDQEVIKMSREIQEELAAACDSKISSVASSAEKPQRNAYSANYEVHIKEEIAHLNSQIEAKKAEIADKREFLFENFRHFICYKHLIERNKHLEKTGVFDPLQKNVKLPFILLATKDSPDNQIDLTYGRHGGSYSELNIAMKKPFNMLGDVDALMKLKFDRVEEEWLREQIPAGLEHLFEQLSERQLKSIIYKKKVQE